MLIKLYYNYKMNGGLVNGFDGKFIVPTKLQIATNIGNQTCQQIRHSYKEHIDTSWTTILLITNEHKLHHDMNTISNLASNGKNGPLCTEINTGMTSL